jgi:hypothetical protein
VRDKMSKRRYITEELRALRLRRAKLNEAGWFVTVFDGERNVRVFATDLPR